jgi:hypothetical protein
MKGSQALLEAVDQALAGDWQRAHEIVSDREDDEIANWIHGVVHWMEGDRDNARYWFGRCGRPLGKTLVVDDELRAIRAAVENRSAEGSSV